MLIAAEFLLYWLIFAAIHFFKAESSWLEEGRMRAADWRTRFLGWACFLALTLWIYYDQMLIVRWFGSALPPLVIETLVSGALFFCAVELFWCAILRKDYYVGSGL